MMHSFARRNLAAFTEPGGCYPQYVSINEERGHVTITVRSPLEPCGECGATAQAMMTSVQFEVLMRDALANLNNICDYHLCTRIGYENTQNGNSPTFPPNC